MSAVTKVESSVATVWPARTRSPTLTCSALMMEVSSVWMTILGAVVTSRPCATTMRSTLETVAQATAAATRPITR